MIILGKHFKTILLIIFFLFFLSLNLEIKKHLVRPILKIDKQDSALNLNYNLYHYFNLGNKRLISSALWVATILESDISHYKKRDDSSWMYLRFITISKLDPKFYYNYYFGGLYLSVVKDDIVGASNFYNKGLEIYPNDLPLLKNAAFHFYFEAKDIERSKVLYEKINTLDKKNIHSKFQIAKILTAENSPETAYQLLAETYNSNISENRFIKEKIFEKMNALKTEIDLKCLNQAKSNCSLQDLKGNFYILKNGKYTSKYPNQILK